MAVSKVAPLADNVEIVRPDGTPTPYFVRQLARLLAEKAVLDSQVEATAALDILPGAGIIGGGPLDGSAGDITISADPEFIRDTIGAALVAGSNITITVNDGANTITIAGTGASSAWTLGKKWDFALDGAVATIDYVLPAGAADIYVIARGVTRASSGLDALRFSTDGGSTYYAGASDYEWDNGSGANNTAAYAQTYNTANAGTTARYWQVGWLGLNVNGAPKATHTYVLANGLARYRFVGSLAPVNAVRVLNGSAGGTLTGGQVYILYR